ncbi:short chain dehydrogenase/reductase family protein [Trichodelitschia bisporula]|uniref:Short chain dehydrogenase/reductase family protein n=1 Tax=Trichodelitschia bisporula TaxID=703511 RepID=A0A6G1I9H7_9PEZI|nr:short chain dehydrogenase/reductase family protein [Trichodelitschia bisporula]
MEELSASRLSPSSASCHPALRLPATCNPPSEQNPPEQAVWIIFGATGQLGRSLVRAAISHGDKVTSVGWTQEDSMEDVRGWQETNSISMLCDVRVRETVDAVIKKSIEHWGRIDVIANCTGYGVMGSCEDQDEHEIRNQFDTNFMGTLNILQLSLPHFRAQEYGRYLIFSSTSGALGVPGLGPFCATKYAVEGLIESLLYEIDTYNVKATLVEPSHMRPDEHDTMALGLKKYAAFKVKAASEPYAVPNAPAGHAKRMVQWLNDRQPTSTVKSAELIWQLAHCSYPPLRLLLGTYAVESIRDRLRYIIEEIEDWKHLNFPVTAAEDAAQKEAAQDSPAEQSDKE